VKSTEREAIKLMLHINAQSQSAAVVYPRETQELIECKRAKVYDFIPLQ
jgi:hypothetical protein